MEHDKGETMEKRISRLEKKVAKLERAAVQFEEHRQSWIDLGKKLRKLKQGEDRDRPEAHEARK
jgi:hypothetical protein